MSRARRSLSGPPPNSELRRFPRATLAAGREVFRAHTVGNGPWWFSSTMANRFDLPDPRGTCYVATSVAAAFRERVGGRLSSRNTITSAFADQTQVSRLPMPSPHRLANTTSARAAQWVTREISTTTEDDYVITQAWATALHERGFDGIRYEARHATGPDDLAVALFGDAGGRSWAVDPKPMSGRYAASEAGMTVADPPRTIVTRPPGFAAS